MIKQNYQNRKAGVAILFAILLVSIVLAVSLTLFNITFRQLILSSLARESQFAFYAADSARNCARHYDSLETPGERPFGYFGLSGSSLVYNQPTVATLNCGQLVTFTPPGSFPLDASPIVFNFTVVFNSGDKDTCARVTVTKYRGDVDSLGKTKIESRGYNNYDSTNATGCYRVSDRTVERASKMVY